MIEIKQQIKIIIIPENVFIDYNNVWIFLDKQINI